MSFFVENIVIATQGQLIQKKSSTFSQVSIDGRTAKKDALFIAIKGTHQDGHLFIDQALSQGATGALVQSGKGNLLAAQYPNLTIIEVADTTIALGHIAQYHLQQIKQQQELKVIAITGSYGKTTTKEMLSSILQVHAEGQILSTEGNLNNHFGVPLMLLKLNKQHRFAIFELGMSALGEISYLASLCQPDIGIITGVGPAHLEQLGSLEKIAQAKSELFFALPENGVALYPQEDEVLMDYFQKSGLLHRHLQFHTVTSQKHFSLPQNTITEKTISQDKNVQVLASKVDPNGLSVTLSCPSTSLLPTETFEVQISLLGFYERNVALAVLAARILGIDTKTIQKGLSFVKPSKHRCQLIVFKERNIIDDCYNANPESTKAAISLLCTLRKHNQTPTTKFWLVFGDMLELGMEELRFHQEIGALAAHQGINGIFSFGPLAQIAAQTAASMGIWSQSFDSISKLKQVLFEKTQPGDFILLKGSRGMKLERLLEESL